jgi:GT2 family glycosyltransferase
VRASLIIPTFNRGSILCDTMKMALLQDYRNYEIIVVDQTPEASHDVMSVVTGAQGRIQYCRLDTPNLPRARNEGVKRATGDIVVFIDDDVQMASDYVTRHVHHYADATVGAVMGLLTPLGPWMEDTLIRNYRRMFEFKDELSGGLATVSWVNGGNTSYRRAAIIEAGLSDERFTGSAWGEDADLAVRVKHLGYKLLFDPKIKLTHLEATVGGCENRSDDWAERRAHEHLTLSLYFLLKNLNILGRAVVLRKLASFYRKHVVARPVLVQGVAALRRRHRSFMAGLIRAYRCLDDLSLPIIEG